MANEEKEIKKSIMKSLRVSKNHAQTVIRQRWLDTKDLLRKYRLMILRMVSEITRRKT